MPDYAILTDHPNQKYSFVKTCYIACGTKTFTPKTFLAIRYAFEVLGIVLGHTKNDRYSHIEQIGNEILRDQNNTGNTCDSVVKINFILSILKSRVEMDPTETGLKDRRRCRN